MATALKVPEKAAKSLLKQLNMKPGTTPTKLAKQLIEAKENLNGDSIEDMDLKASAKSLMEEISEAVDEERDIKVVAAEAEEEEEEEAPKKKGAKVKVKTKVKTKAEPKTKTKMKTKVKTKTKASGGKTAKDQVFEAWLKSPATSPKDMADKLESKLDVKPTTISKWISNWNRGAGVLPRASKGREKEVRVARKAAKAG